MPLKVTNNVTIWLRVVSETDIIAKHYKITVTVTPDTTAPTLQDFTPTDGAANIPVDANVTLTFSEPMNTGSCSFELSQNGVSQSGLMSPPIWSVNDTVATIACTGLEYSTAYDFGITGAEDLAGNPIATTGRVTDFTTVAAQKHSIAIAPMTNGTVMVQGGLTEAAEGETIRLTVTPDNDYRLKAGSLRFNGIQVSGSSFSMPSAAVTISAEFEPIPQTPSVSTNYIDMTVNGTATFQVYLGDADSATVTSDDPSIATVTPADVNTSPATVTVTGEYSGTTTISLGWSGGAMDGQFTDVDVVVYETPGPGYTVTFNANGGTVGDPFLQTEADGTLAGLPTPVWGSYTFNGWFTQTRGGTRITASHVFTADTTVYAQWSSPSSNSGGDRYSGSTTSDSIGGLASTLSTVPPSKTITADDLKAALESMRQNDKPYAQFSASGQIEIPAEILRELGQTSLYVDTTDSQVQVRIVIPQPGLITTSLTASGSVKGADVDSCKAFFEKWFTNKVRVVQLDHVGSYGQVVEIAVKVDLTGMDTTKLYFYNYDKATNTYKIIEMPAYRIDANGYLHFNTEWGGDIIISEGKLEKR